MTRIIEPDKDKGWPSHMRADISQGQLLALRDELKAAKSRIIQLEAYWLGCIGMIREWPLGNPHRDFAMKLYQDWCDDMDKRPQVQE